MRIIRDLLYFMCYFPTRLVVNSMYAGYDFKAIIQTLKLAKCSPFGCPLFDVHGPPHHHFHRLTQTLTAPPPLPADVFTLQLSHHGCMTGGGLAKSYACISKQQIPLEEFLPLLYFPKRNRRRWQALSNIC